MSKSQKGFAALELFLISVIIVTVAGVGWYAIHTKHQTDKILAQADKISQNIPKITPIHSFDGCKKSAGSMIQETYPETCITKSGTRFTNPAQQSVSSPSH